MAVIFNELFPKMFVYSECRCFGRCSSPVIDYMQSSSAHYHEFTFLVRHSFTTKGKPFFDGKEISYGKGLVSLCMDQCIFSCNVCVKAPRVIRALELAVESVCHTELRKNLGKVRRWYCFVQDARALA